MHPEYLSLAEFTLKTWWWPALITVATTWFWRQSVRGKKGGAEGLKLLLVLNNATVGVLLFRGILLPGWASWLQPGSPAAGTWAHGLVFLFFLTALLWLMDLALGRTLLVLPRNPIWAVTVIVACTLGLLFPALEWIGGNRLPYAQAFGTGSVPLIIFSAALLGGARPNNWLGKLLLILIVLGSTDALAAAVAGKHWYYLAAPVFSLAALTFTWMRPRFIELSPKS
jgi:hypothetical protein